MKIRLLQLILALVASPSFAVTNADYAKLDAEVLSGFKSSTELTEFIIDGAPEKDRPPLQQYFRTHPIQTLLSVRALGSVLQFSDKTHVWRVEVTDGNKRIFKWRGAEFELPDSLSATEQLQRLDSIFGTDHARWWPWFLPLAYAQDDDLSTPAAQKAQLEAANQTQRGRDKYAAIHAATNAAVNVDGLCFSRTKTRSAHTDPVFSDSSNKKIELMLANEKLKKKPQPQIQDWASRSLAHLDAAKENYCSHHKWFDRVADYIAKPTHYFNLPGNGEDSTVSLHLNFHTDKGLEKINACETITHALKCLHSFVDNHIQSPLYPEQDQQLTQWLVQIQRPDRQPPTAAQTAINSAPATR